MAPVRGGPQTAASPLKCGHHVALPVPRKENPKGNNPGRVDGRQRHHRRVLRTRFPLCVFTFVWGCHTESPANSLREVPSPGGASGKRPPWRLSKPVLGVVPVRLEKYRSGAAAHRANSSSIFTRPYTTDLGQRSKLGSERRGGVEISTKNARHRKLPQSAENPQRS